MRYCEYLHAQEVSRCVHDRFPLNSMWYVIDNFNESLSIFHSCIRRKVTARLIINVPLNHSQVLTAPTPGHMGPMALPWDKDIWVTYYPKRNGYIIQEFAE